jgi:hypothetical protein
MFSISSLDCEIFIYVSSSNLKLVCSCDNSVSEVFSLIHIIYILFKRLIPFEFLQQLLFTFYKVVYFQQFCMFVFIYLYIQQMQNLFILWLFLVTVNFPCALFPSTVYKNWLSSLFNVIRTSEHSPEFSAFCMMVWIICIFSTKWSQLIFYSRCYSLRTIQCFVTIRAFWSQGSHFRFMLWTLLISSRHVAR